MAVGDVIAQFVVEKKSVDDYSATRTGRFLVFGTFALVSVVCVYELQFEDMIHDSWFH